MIYIDISMIQIHTAHRKTTEERVNEVCLGLIKKKTQEYFMWESLIKHNFE